jgi:hypothetical protein
MKPGAETACFFLVPPLPPHASSSYPPPPSLLSPYPFLLGFLSALE